MVVGGTKLCIELVSIRRNREVGQLEPALWPDGSEEVKYEVWIYLEKLLESLFSWYHPGLDEERSDSYGKEVMLIAVCLTLAETRQQHPAVVSGYQ